MLKDHQYQSIEKNLLHEDFKALAEHENIYPGGFKIVSNHLEKNMHTLERHYQQHKAIRNPYADSILKNMFHELTINSPMDTLFEAMKKKYQLSKNLDYLLTVNNIKLRFGPGVVTTLYDHHENYSFLKNDAQTKSGYILDGHLQTPLTQNIAYSVTTGSSLQYSYDMTFTVYVDHNNRDMEVLKSAVPTLMLTLFALTTVMAIYYITFKNWLQQKKLAEMKSDFINSITHEFHTPISTIIVANKSLQNEKVLLNKYRVKELTEVIYRQSKRLEKLFGQVLDITKIENANIEKEETDIYVLIDQILKAYRLKIADKHVQLVMNQIPSDRHMVLLNEFWFTTMLFNIFDNAIKYNDHQEKHIHIHFVINDGKLQLMIADNGIGMEDQTVKNIFDKFYRANKEEMQHVNGLGLGLYYAQQCVYAHNWKMLVNSKVGIGSEFIIFIS